MKDGKVAHDARKAVLEQLALAFDRYAELEQNLALVGNYAEAEGARLMGLTILRAYDAEMHDPEPDGLQ
jgi:hypothetical protein